MSMSSADDVLRNLLPQLAAALRAVAPGDDSEHLVERIALAWPAIAGPGLAHLTGPIAYEPAGGLLSVGVEAGWREAVFRARTLLLERARRVEPRVRGVRLVTTEAGRFRVEMPASPPAAQTRAVPADPRTVDITDAGLRSALDALCDAWHTKTGGSGGPLLGLVLVLAWVAATATPARAHLGSPYGNAVGTLRDATAVAVVRVLEETESTQEGAATAVERVTEVVGHVPRRFTLLQSPPHFHRMRRDDLILAPLGAPGLGARVHYMSQSETALVVQKSEVGEVRALVQRWRQLPAPALPGGRVAMAAQRPDESTALGRRLALEQLVADPTVTSATLTDTALDGLARAVGNPAGPGSWRLGLVRVFALMASIGDTRGLSRLCKAVPGLAPLPLRAAVITALAEGAPACASAVLSACAAAANDPLAARCTTLFDRVGR